MKNSSDLSLSVVIPTRNRVDLLKICLESLVRQGAAIAEVIVVNNNSSDKTTTVLNSFKKVLNLKIINSTSHVSPRLYNLGARNASSKIVVFIDDDCVVGSNWAKEIKKFHLINKEAVAVGKTLSLPRNNFFAQLMSKHYQNWIKTNMKDGKLVSLDTKNSSLPKKILEKNNYFLERKFSSHDIEFGHRISRLGYKIYYEPKIKLFHHERTHLFSFLKQHLRMAKSEAVLDSVLAKEEKVGLLSYEKTLDILKSYCMKVRENFKLKRSLYYLKLILIYFLLVIIRFYGYTSKKLLISSSSAINSAKSLFPF